MSGAALGNIWTRCFKWSLRVLGVWGSISGATLEAEQGGGPAHHPHFSPNNSSLVGFCTSYVWTRNPAAFSFFFFLSWNHWSSPNCSFYRWAHWSTLGTLPKLHTVGNILDMLRKGEQCPHGNKKEPQVSTAPLSNHVKLKTVYIHSPLRFN